MPSGKQILLSLLTEYSQKQSDSGCSENLRAGFLIHGSTPDHMWADVDNILDI